MPKDISTPQKPKGEMPWWVKSGNFTYGATNDPWRKWGEAMQAKWLKEQQAKYLEYVQSTRKAAPGAGFMPYSAGAGLMPYSAGTLRAMPTMIQ